MATNPNGVLGKYGSIFKKLQQQAAGRFGDGTEEEAQQQTRAPIGYGVFASGLAGALQQGANDPAFGGADIAALQGYAEKERASVTQATEADRRFALTQALFKNPTLLQDPRAMQRLSNNYNIFDPIATAVDAAVDRRGAVASGQKITAEGLKAAREAGVTVDEDTIQNLFSNPITGEAATGYRLFGGNITPDEQARITSAEAAKMKAEADMYSAHNAERVARAGRSSSSGDGTTTTFVVPVPGGGMATIKGKDGPAVLAEGMDARNYNRSDRPDAPAYGPNRLQHVKNVAKQRNLTVRDTPSGIIVQDSRGNTVRYDRNGKVVR